MRIKDAALKANDDLLQSKDAVIKAKDALIRRLQSEWHAESQVKSTAAPRHLLRHRCSQRRCRRPPRA